MLHWLFRLGLYQQLTSEPYLGLVGCGWSCGWSQSQGVLSYKLTDHHFKEGSHVVQLLLDICVEQCLVALAAAPEH